MATKCFFWLCLWLFVAYSRKIQFPHSSGIWRKWNKNDNLIDFRVRSNPASIAAPEPPTTQAENWTSILRNDSNFNIFTRINSNQEIVLTHFGALVAGAVARSVAAVVVHPVNVAKTMLQQQGGVLPPLQWSVLSRGMGAQFFLSLPHGAINYAVTEKTKSVFSKLLARNVAFHRLPEPLQHPLMDFLASAVSTFICSVVSTPQMVIVDRIMVGLYPNLMAAVQSIQSLEGLSGFYTGWSPALLQKIPSYSLTYAIFQLLKSIWQRTSGRAANSAMNAALGGIAATLVCSAMIPLDTIKTRMVTLNKDGVVVYRSMWECYRSVVSSEGVLSLYRALPMRMLSVVPMIGVQYAVYEAFKGAFIRTRRRKLRWLAKRHQRQQVVARAEQVATRGLNSDNATRLCQACQLNVSEAAEKTSSFSGNSIFVPLGNALSGFQCFCESFISVNLRGGAGNESMVDDDED